MNTLLLLIIAIPAALDLIALIKWHTSGKQKLAAERKAFEEQLESWRDSLEDELVDLKSKVKAKSKAKSKDQ